MHSCFCEKMLSAKDSKAKSQRNLASQLCTSVGAVNNILKRNREYEYLSEENCNPNLTDRGNVDI